MGNSYIIQGVNVICSNMQIPEPNKLGISRDLLPTVKHTGKNAYFLTVADKKLEKCFKCKMPTKKWGGLATLCMGIALAGAVALIALSGGLGAIPLLAAAIAVTEAGVSIAAAASVITLGLSAYKEAHDCDVILNSPDWIKGHDSVRFQKNKALLNRSYMTCSQGGGRLDLIVSDVIALQASKIISRNNGLEINVHQTSQLLIGIIAGLTGGASPTGVLITIGCYVLFESEKSNQDSDVKKDVINTTKQYGVEVGQDAAERGLKHGASKLEAWLWKNIAISRVINGSSETAIHSATNMWGMAANAPKTIWKGFAQTVGSGFVGTVIGFGIDQNANKIEGNLEKDVRNKIKIINTEDNDISVIAIKS